MPLPANVNANIKIGRGKHTGLQIVSDSHRNMSKKTTLIENSVSNIYSQ
jgi:hypothetical protein